MKKFLFASLLAASFAPAAFAQARCEVDMIDNNNRVLNTFSGRTDRWGTCSAVRDCEMDARRVRTTVRCVERRITRPDPRPNPRPNPIPQPRDFLEVTVLAEDTLLRLSGYTVNDIQRECERNAPWGSTDEVTIVTNNSNVRFLSNAWLSSRQEFCRAVVNNIDTYSRSYGYVSAYGDMDRMSFTLSASSKAEALAQCADAYRRSGMRSIDEIRLTVNNGRPLMARSYSWWDNAAEVCHEVMKLVDQSVW
jgi:hypothetical protein